MQLSFSSLVVISSKIGGGGLHCISHHILMLWVAVSNVNHLTFVSIERHLHLIDQSSTSRLTRSSCGALWYSTI